MYFFYTLLDNFDSYIIRKVIKDYKNQVSDVLFKCIDYFIYYYFKA